MKQSEHTDLIVKFLTGEITPEENLLLSEKLKEDARFEQEFKNLEKIWSISANPSFKDDHYDAKAGWNRLRSRIEEDNLKAKTVHFLPSNWLNIAASITLILVFAFLLIQFGPLLLQTSTKNQVALKNKKKEVTAKYYESVKRAKVTSKKTSNTIDIFYLPDSTLVWLNTDSEIIWKSDFGNKNREIILIGEAYFDVTRNESRPFVVHAGSTVTTVLGTSFNLTANDSSSTVEIAVVSGKVSFASEDDELFLEKDQAAVWNENSGILSMYNRKDPYLGWKEKSDNIKTTSRYQDEMMHPEKYLSTDLIWKRNIIRQTVIEGYIYNTALLTTYSNIELKVSYYNNKGVLIGENKLIADTNVRPGSSVSYKHKLPDWFENTKDVRVEVIGVKKKRDAF